MINFKALATARHEPLPDYGDLIEVATFVGHVRSGGFIDYDGHGGLATLEFMYDTNVPHGPDNLMIHPSDVASDPDFLDKCVEYGVTHICWFNR